MKKYDSANIYWFKLVTPLLQNNISEMLLCKLSEELVKMQILCQ